MGKLKYSVVCDDLVRKYSEQNAGNFFLKGLRKNDVVNILKHEMYLYMYL